MLSHLTSTQVAMNDLIEKKFSRFASLKLRRLSLRRPASNIAELRAPGMVVVRNATVNAATPVAQALISLPVATQS
jgi:hypothetical protein